MNFNFESFSQDLKALGFNQVLERHWEPLGVADSHTHPFDAKALVVRGEIVRPGS
jgi:hypothetical protein